MAEFKSKPYIPGEGNGKPFGEPIPTMLDLILEGQSILYRMDNPDRLHDLQASKKRLRNISRSLLYIYMLQLGIEPPMEKRIFITLHEKGDWLDKDTQWICDGFTFIHKNEELDVPLDIICPDEDGRQQLKAVFLATHEKTSN